MKPDNKQRDIFLTSDSLSIPPQSTICLEIRSSTCLDKTTPSYTKQFQDGRPRFDKCIRYFVDLQNYITKKYFFKKNNFLRTNFQNLRALDRKILHYSRFEAYEILFYLSHQCLSSVRILIRFDISIFSFITSTTQVTRGLGTSLWLNISTNQQPEGFLLLLLVLLLLLLLLVHSCRHIKQ